MAHPPFSAPAPVAGAPDPSDPSSSGSRTEPGAHDPQHLLAALRPSPPVGWRERVELLAAGRPLHPARLAAGLVLVLAAAGLSWWLLRPPAPPIEAQLPQAASPSSGAASSGSPSGSPPGGSAAAPGAATTSTSITEVVVQASGAVSRPGVYRLPGTGRVDDLVRAAGGLAPDADADRVNLAAPLADGERVWIPRRGEPQPPDVVAGAGGPGASGAGSGGPGAGADGATAGPPAVVDLNTATAEQLDTLPGVGPATATAILSYRDEHGRFSSVDELLEVRGIGDAKLEQLRSLVTV